MKLQTVIDHLKTGEFQFTNLGDNDEENVSSNNLPMIVNNINLALIDLYKRFNLSLRELYVQQYAQIQKYKLSSEHAQSNTTSEELKYLIDTDDDPFTDDILQILEVFNEVGCKLPLNDSNDCNSLFTPKHNVLQIPCPVDENAVVIVYRAAPELLKSTCNLSAEVDLPITFLEALLYYVAYRLKSSRPDQESQNEGNNYFAKYNEAIAVIKVEGLYNSTNTSNLKLIARGFS